MTPLELLKDWVEAQHRGQLIKRTNQPYFRHLLAVAEMADAATPMGYEIGLCHDLLEKTTVTAHTLREALFRFGYSSEQAGYITSCVVDLTDVFTAAAFPGLRKGVRKEKEAARLVTISPGAQTVKYADLVYNIGWFLQYKPHKAKKYLVKKRSLLSEMTQGDPQLRQKALNMINQALRKA